MLMVTRSLFKDGDESEEGGDAVFEGNLDDIDFEVEK